MVDTISADRQRPVLYVPPRHAIALTATMNATPTAPQPSSPPASMATISGAYTPLDMSGSHSAFTAVYPREYRQWTDHHSLISHQQQLSNIQQSYTKLFARNELLKLLVTKQLRSLYTHSSAIAICGDQLSACTDTPLQRQPSSTSLPSRHCFLAPIDCSTKPANRLIELSSVIKAINATKVSASCAESDNAAPKDNSRSYQRDWEGMRLAMSESRKSPMVFRCDWNGCYRTFDTAEQWTIHVTHTHVIAHPDDGLYYCQWKDCGRANNGFNARYKMLIHVRSHTNDKPYRCPHCAKAFLRSETLRIHKRIHSSEKMFVCKFLGCTKRYTDPSSLRKHVKTKDHVVIEV